MLTHEFNELRGKKNMIDEKEMKDKDPEESQDQEHKDITKPPRGKKFQKRDNKPASKLERWQDNTEKPSTPGSATSSQRS